MTKITKENEEWVLYGSYTNEGLAKFMAKLVKGSEVRPIGPRQYGIYVKEKKK